MPTVKESDSSGCRKIFLVDDHPIVREGLRQVIDQEPDFRVVGEAEDAPAAYAAIAETHPDVVVVDLLLREGDGIDLIKRLQKLDATIPVLVLTMHAESFYAERALRAGARGFLTKEDAGTSIVGAIRRVLNGEVFVSEKVAPGLLQRLLGVGNGEGDSIDRLSDRELQVFELIGKGKATKEIADDLNLSVKTVETYRANIKEKLGLRDATELVRFSIRWILDRESSR